MDSFDTCAQNSLYQRNVEIEFEYSPSVTLIGLRNLYRFPHLLGRRFTFIIDAAYITGLCLKKRLQEVTKIVISLILQLSGAETRHAREAIVVFFSQSIL